MQRHPCVLLVQRLDIRGLTVILYLGVGAFTGYVHLSWAAAKPGLFVNIGDVIAAVGTTGRCQGNQLHFALAVGDVIVDLDYWTRIGRASHCRHVISRLP